MHIMSDTPKISIIIPTYNRPNSLSRCLRSLEDQITAPYEVIIVVDGGAVDMVQNVINSFKYNGKYPIIQVINNKNRGLTVSRNIGFKYATGDIIAYLDDDVTLVPSWVYQIAKGYKDNKNAVGVGGQVIDVVPFITGKFYKHIYKIRSLLFKRRIGMVNILGMPYPLDKHCDGYKQVNYLCGGNMSFCRDIFVSHKFDEVMRRGDDIDFCVRLSRNEKRILVYNSQAIVYHHRDPIGTCQARGPESMYWAFTDHIYYLLKNYNYKYIRVAFYSLFILIYSIFRGERRFLAAIPDGLKKYRIQHRNIQ